MLACLQASAKRCAHHVTRPLTEPHFYGLSRYVLRTFALSGPVIKEKVNQLMREMGINFVATNGWFYRFKTRRGLCFKSIVGEAASVTPETLREWKEKTLPSILSHYSICFHQKLSDRLCGFHKVGDKLA